MLTELKRKQCDMLQSLHAMIHHKDKVRLSLCADLQAHQAGGYPGFRSMKRLGQFLLLPRWAVSTSQDYPHH